MNSQNYLERNLINTKINRNIISVITVIGASLLIALSAQFAFPIAGPTPVTLQTGVVVLIALLIGQKRAVASVILYILEGFIGLPVFAGGVAGMAVLTANLGFLMSFIPLAYIVGKFADSRFSESKLGMLVTLVVANVVVYALGCLYLTFVFGFSKAIITNAVLPFITGDILKMGSAVVIAKAINKHSHE